jgi:hypothetical protein
MGPLVEWADSQRTKKGGYIMPEMLDLPRVFESAYRARSMRNQVEEQDKARSLSQIMNNNYDPRTGDVNQAGVRQAAGAQGQGFQAEQVLGQLNDEQRKRVKSQLEEMDTNAWALLDEYNANLKADPKTANAKLQMSYDKLVVNNPDLYKLKQQGHLPAKIDHTQLVGMLGKNQYHYELLQGMEEKIGLAKKALDKKGTTAKTVAEDKNVKALASEYDLEEDEVRAVMKSYKTLAEENFPKALAKYRLEGGGKKDSGAVIKYDAKGNRIQ